MPKIVDKEQRKQELAEAALELFANEGFLIPISRAAQVLGVGKGTLYEYFESKEELIYCSILAWVRQFEQGFAQVVSSDADPRERLRTLVYGMMDRFLEDERTIRLVISMMQLMLGADNVWRDYPVLAKSLEGSREAVVAILLDGVSRSIFRPEVARDANRVAVNLMAYLDGIAIHHFLSRGYLELHDQVALYLDSLIHTLEVEAG